ncbi:MAG TPA: dienelactone hydrolase family protein [Myxococcales bacterium]|nr:dienelactone hydrolase family protein [Myxococcales bacterium]
MRILLAAALAALPAFAQEHDHGAASDKDSKVPAHEKHPMDPNAPKPAGQMITLPVQGEQANAYLARPQGNAKGAILVVHEYWGLNDWVKSMADRLAKDGYLALAVDLYKGKVATDPKEAQTLMANKDQQWGTAVEVAGLKWLKSNAAGAKVATIGWCMGGGESLNASLADPNDVNATVIYYGLPVTDVDKLKTLQGPVLGIWANQDGWITPDKVKAFDQALTQAGVKHEFHAYDANHAFANPSGGRYNGPAAKDAWQKTEAFLKKNLAG